MDSFRATVQWYLWVFELPGSLQKMATSPFEVFLNDRKNLENEIDLKTIVDTQQVSKLLLFIPLSWYTLYNYLVRLLLEVLISRSYIRLRGLGLSYFTNDVSNMTWFCIRPFVIVINFDIVYC